MKRLLFLLPFFYVLFAWQPAYAQTNEILVLEIEAPVFQTMHDYFERGLNEAERRDASAVLIVLDTPGGAVATTLEIIQLFRASEIPIIVYVAPRGAQAASAGSLITAAAHASAMAPETVIGAASPINSDGSDINETSYRKAVEDLKATMRSLTERRSEEAVALGEAMIEEARAVSSTEALEAGFIDIVASDVTTLLADLDGMTVYVQDQPIDLETKSATQVPFEMNVLEQILLWLTNPILLGFLLTIGVQAILIELNNPGINVAGVVGIICIVLALYGAGQLSVNWIGLGLVFVAVGLFVTELFTTNNGVLSLAGVVCLVGGLLVLFNSPDAPEYARLSWTGAVSIGLFALVTFGGIAYLALRAQQMVPVSGTEGMIGRAGTVRAPLTSTNDQPPYTGQVLVYGELWKAVSDEPLPKNASVAVKQVDGLTIKVTKL